MSKNKERILYITTANSGTMVIPLLKTIISCKHPDLDNAEHLAISARKIAQLEEDSREKFDYDDYSLIFVDLPPTKENLDTHWGPIIHNTLKLAHGVIYLQRFEEDMFAAMPEGYATAPSVDLRGQFDLESISGAIHTARVQQIDDKVSV